MIKGTGSKALLKPDGELQSVREKHDAILCTRLDRIERQLPPSKVAMERAESALSGTILLANKSRVPVGEGIHWRTTFPINDDTSRLYLHSLLYVSELLYAYRSTKNDRFLTKVLDILRSWLDFYQDQDNRRYLESLKSADHSTCMRTHVLIDVIQVDIESRILDRDLAARVVTALYHHALWLEDDSYYGRYNHGVMMDIALLMASLQFSAVEPSRRWRQKATSRLADTLKVAFTEEGINVENTPGYHNFNIKLYESALDLLDHYGISSPYTEMARPIMAKANLALRHMVRQDGVILPIGDSSFIRHPTVEPINEPISYPGSGYAFIKDKDLYLSLKCGFSGLNHKHVDDSSITLTYNGWEVLVDGGSYTYDLENEYRRYLESCLGHSGFFFEQLVGHLAKDLRSKYLFDRAGVTRLVEDEGTVSVGCEYLALRRIQARRNVHVLLPNVIIIIDRATSRFRGARMLQNYLFSPRVEAYRKDEGTLELRQGKCSGVLRQHLPTDRLSLAKGETSPVMGWYSPYYMDKTPAYCAQWHKRRKQVGFVTSLLLRTGAEGEWTDLEVEISEDLQEVSVTPRREGTRPVRRFALPVLTRAP